MARRSLRLIARVALAAALLSTVAAAAPLPLARVEVHGNRRTAASVIRDALGVDPGDPVDPAEAPRLAQRVANLRLFQDVRVEALPDGAGLVLRVHVVERWTLIPFPIVRASSVGLSGGVFVVESNLLGLGKTVVAGGLLSSRGPSGLVLYQDPRVAGTDFVLFAKAGHEELDKERFDGAERVAAFRDTQTELELRVGYRFAETFTVEAGPYRTTDRAEPIEGAVPDGRSTEQGAALVVQLGKQDYKIDHVTGALAEARFRHASRALGAGRAIDAGELRVSVAVPGPWSHTLMLGGRLAAVDGDPGLDPFRLGGGAGARGFRDAGHWAERAATLDVEYVLPVARLGWGTVSACGFVDAGVSRWRRDDTRWIAPGAGVRLYLKGIALPALGLDVAWSSAVRESAVAFSIGYAL